ncbi:hypothetical protein ACLM5J_06045 [Nocardioides sp. Bht2]|uniref:hypothetical protein n=1 Tax=Nocardioides sp. Bht2 TaxID=3392297 RepID=UPI0039B444A5
MTLRNLVGLTATGVLSVAAGLVGVLGTATPAEAAVCSGSTGVTVVVDYNGLGGGTSTGCAADGGDQRASAIFPGAGFPLQYASRSQGFVCRVTGVPSDDPCTEAAPATKYWSLWWSDGRSGTWNYASQGAGSLRIPEGGYVAFSWHEGTGRAAAPGVSPTPRTASKPQPNKPKPSKPSKPNPSAKPTKQATPSSAPTSTGAASPSATPTDVPAEAPSATPTGVPSPGASAGEPGADPTATVAPDAVPAEEITQGPPTDGKADGAADSDDGGLPIWVPIGAVVVVAAIGGAVAWRRRHA